MIEFSSNLGLTEENLRDHYEVFESEGSVNTIAFEDRKDVLEYNIKNFFEEDSEKVTHIFVGLNDHKSPVEIYSVKDPGAIIEKVRSVLKTVSCKFEAYWSKITCNSKDMVLLKLVKCAS